MSQSDAPERLQEQLKQEEQLLDSLDDANWNKSRKMARERQHNIDMQKKRREDYQKNNDKN